MNVKTCFAVIADRNISDCAQDLALLRDFDFLVSFLLKVEPADGGVLKGTDGSQGSCTNSGLVCKFRQDGERFFAGFENDDAGLCSRVAGN